MTIKSRTVALTVPAYVAGDLLQSQVPNVSKVRVDLKRDACQSVMPRVPNATRAPACAMHNACIFLLSGAVII